MNILLKLLIFIVGSLFGFSLIKYRERIVRFIGKSDWAEQRIGVGGTYTMWQLIGLGFIVVSFLIALLA